MFTRPLLRSASYPVISPSVFTLTNPGEGAWPNIGGAPFSFNGYSYIGYPDNTGLIRVVIFDETTGTKVIRTVGGPTTIDQHNKPAVLRRTSDDKLVVAIELHSAANVWTRVSVNSLTSDPLVTGGWFAATDISGQLGGGGHTYAALFEQGSNIILFDRAISSVDGLSYWKTYAHALDTSDLSAGWNLGINLVSGLRVYGLACQNGSRLDFFFTNGSYASDYASLYHLSWDGTTYRNSAGTSLGSPPFAFSALTKVYDGATAGARVPVACVNNGTDIVVVVPVHTGALSGSGVRATDMDYIYCRAPVGSAAWSNETIAASIGGLTEAYEEGSVAIDVKNINHLLVSRRATSIITDPFRMYDYLTADAGVSWTQRLLGNTGNPDMYPWFLLNYSNRLQAVWLKGTFPVEPADPNTYNDGIQGYGLAA